MSGWARGWRGEFFAELARRGASAQSRAERHHAAGVVRHVISFAGFRVVAPWHRRCPVDRERVEVGEAKLIGNGLVVPGVRAHPFLESRGLKALGSNSHVRHEISTIQDRRVIDEEITGK